MDGYPVWLQGREYYMDTEYSLCVKHMKYSSDSPENIEDVFLKVDIPLDWFLDKCANMPEEDYWEFAANKVLREI